MFCLLHNQFKRVGCHTCLYRSNSRLKLPDNRYYILHITKIQWGPYLYAVCVTFYCSVWCANGAVYDVNSNGPTKLPWGTPCSRGIRMRCSIAHQDLEASVVKIGFNPVLDCFSCFLLVGKCVNESALVYGIKGCRDVE